MAELPEHELAFTKAFVRRDKRKRYQQFLADPKRRREVLDRLNHHADLEWKFAARIPRDKCTAPKLEELIRTRTACPTCYVISDDLDLDGQQVALREALEQVVMHDWGTIVSCVPGTLALYKEESPGDWYLLERKAA